jgi:2'-5' RNA ligase
MTAALRTVPQPLSHRLFFAIRPPREITEVIGQVRDSLDDRATPVTDDRLHVTLLSLPEYDAVPDGMVDQLIEMAAGIEAPRFRIVLDRLVCGAHSALLAPSEPVEGLRLFRERLGFTMIRSGFGLRLGRRFSPHVTLLYNNWRMFDETIDPISWQVEDFVLIHSHVGATKHVELGRWTLGEA